MKAILFLIKLPIFFVKYWSLCFFFTCYIFISMILQAVVIVLKAPFMVGYFLSKICYRFIHYVKEGIVAIFIALFLPFKFLSKKMNAANEEKKKQKEKEIAEKLARQEEEKINRAKKIVEKKEKERIANMKKIEAMQVKKYDQRKRARKEEYKN